MHGWRAAKEHEEAEQREVEVMAYVRDKKDKIILYRSAYFTVRYAGHSTVRYCNKRIRDLLCVLYSTGYRRLYS